MSTRFYEKSLGNLLNEYACKELPKLGVKLGNNTGSSPIVQLANVLVQAIPRAKRSVSEASTLKVPDNVKVGYEDLKKAIASGEDLTPYQGRKTNGRKYAEFTDYLKANYGLDHFHLGGKDKQGRVGRTGEIALGLVANETVYIVDIVQHGRGQPEPWWTKKYLEIMHQEWPEVISPWRIKGFELSHSTGEKEVEHLSKAAVNTMFDLGGGVIYGQIGNGFVANGIHATASHELNRLLWQVEPLHDLVLDHINELGGSINDFKLVSVAPSMLAYRHNEMEVIYVAMRTRRSKSKDELRMLYMNTNGCPEHYLTHEKYPMNMITALLLSKVRVKY